MTRYIRNGTSIVRTHRQSRRDAHRGTRYYKGKEGRIPADVLSDMTPPDREKVRGMRAIPLGKYVGSMPDGACALNAVIAHRQHPGTQIVKGYYLYRPYGSTRWYALDHYFVTS